MAHEWPEAADQKLLELARPGSLLGPNVELRPLGTALRGQNHMKYLLLLLTLLTSCDDGAHERAVIEASWTEHVWGLQYAQDHRTHLCFAGWSTHEYERPVVTLTNVPCTPEVLERIAKTKP